MHNDHNIDDFKPPFAIGNLSDELQGVVTPAHIESLTTCLESIHSAFDAFLAMDVHVLRGLPTIFIVRNSYAAVALIKMYTAVSAKDSRFATIFRTSELKVEYYLDAMINKLSQASEGNQSLVASKFGFIFTMLKSWHTKRLEVLAAGGGATGKPPGMKSLFAAYKNALGQDSNSPMTWTGQPVIASSKGAGAPQSGLQVLSDAAMGQNTPTGSDADANPSAASGSAAMAGQLSAIAPELRFSNPSSSSMGNVMQTTPAALPTAASDQSTMYGYVTGVIEADNFAFTAEELSAMGSLMDDPSWMNFPMEQSGWAF